MESVALWHVGSFLDQGLNQTLALQADLTTGAPGKSKYIFKEDKIETVVVHVSKIAFNLLINERNSRYCKPLQKKSKCHSYKSEKKCSNEFTNRF